MSESLDEVLSGEKPEVVAEKPSRERDESGRFKAKGETAEPAQAEPVAATPAAEPAQAPTAPEPAEERVPLAALTSERKKRQEAERKAAEYERRVREYSQPRAPDPYSDPQGHQAFVERQNMLIDARVDASFNAARRAIKDFDEVMAHWDELKAQHPYLYDQAIQDDAPAYWAYEQVKRHLAMREIGDPVAYKEKLRAELLAEIQQKSPTQRQPAATPQPSLASVPATGRTSDPVWQGPPTMKQILRS